MNSPSRLIADSLHIFEEAGEPVQVALTNELVQLLSDQLYQSPLKAIEELVVNAYDADATECRIYVPSPTDQDKDFIVVFDDGIGMDQQGLVDLWQIGRSNKREEEIQRRRKRKQIGKFGIGKLATCTIANRLTYVTKSDNQVLSVTVDFNDFAASPTGASEPITVPVWHVDDWDKFTKETYIQGLLELACVDSSRFFEENVESWTIAILEKLKSKARKVTTGGLQWVLSTAMPLKPNFRLYLNCEEVLSSKESYEKMFEFDIGELSETRLESLTENTGEEWYVKDGCLRSQSFKSGVSGNVIVTKKTLLGKSEDIERSHGFFIRVRERLVNESDALFGLKALYHGTFNRFRADIRADDLDDELKASRETIEESKLKVNFRFLLREIFNEANKRREDYERMLDEDQPKREGERNVVSPRLVEHPVADAIITQVADALGAEADEGWFYMALSAGTKIDELIQSLYTIPRSKYRYQYTRSGATSRLVKFDPSTSTFWVNEDHDLVKEYASEGRTRIFLEDFVTAEALLEVYLRESQVPPHIVGAVLERRDELLRSLAKDHPYSLSAISRQLLDAAVDEHELEVMLVVAARALGFVAKHIAGAGEPDGIARFTDYPNGEKKIILEAKSSAAVPSLSAIDFAGLHEHMQRHQADGCLLLAPTYPGSSRKDNSGAATRAREQGISCWTVDQLARFIAVAESRQLTARQVLDIVLNCFSPEEVSEAINNLLAEPTWGTRDLYQVILDALQELEGRLSDSHRTVDMVATKVSDIPLFSSIGKEDIERAITDLAGASQGAMTLRGQTIIVHVSHDELERRLEGLTRRSGEPRKQSGFREI